MLSLLKIRHLALVENLTWEIGSGLVCVTGETGAGKSVIVGAIKLVLGERADKSLIRTGEDSCAIEAIFELAKPDVVNAILEDAGLDPCEDNQLVIRRVISQSANKQFVNCSPVTLIVLKSLGQYLVDLHGPHEHQSLLSPERQLDMLDAYMHEPTVLSTYREAHGRWRSLTRELDSLRHAEGATDQEIELLRFQVEEIANAEINLEAEAEIENRYRVASNSSRLVELAGQLRQGLGADDDSVLSRLGDLHRLANELESTDPATAEFTKTIDGAQIELQELESTLSNYLDRLEVDPAELADLEKRLDLLESLKRKYGPNLEDVLQHHDDTGRKLARIEGRSGEIERLEKEIAAARKNVDKTAKKLTSVRKKAAPSLAKEITDHLGELGFKRSHFDVQLSPLDEPTAAGAESVEFLFGPNPGEPPKALRQIASSGEMSRVMLAVKSALAKQDGIPLLVFDEIDANVGGEIAKAVGTKMAALGADHQVVSITHLPQVAALASCHYKVTKEVGDDERTRSLLVPVESKNRVEELARMLGGDSRSARAHAESLLGKG
ncbi:MAG: DNA repair protein RecN [Verrucomicrobiota bacterium]